MPGGKSVSANIKELKASKTKRPQKQIVAIALSEARRAGAKIPKAKRRTDMPHMKNGKLMGGMGYANPS